MPGTRTPTNILKLRGAEKNHPERLKLRADEPTDDRELGECPAGLTPNESVVWVELAAQSIPGVLTHADRPTLEMATRLLNKSRENFNKFSSSEMSNLIKLLSQMGMTPADRSKISLPKKDSANPFDRD